MECTRFAVRFDERRVNLYQFSDATLNTQSKYLNVTTSGNAVWDRECSLTTRARNLAVDLDRLTTL